MKKLVFVFALIAIGFQMQAQLSELTIRTYNQVSFDLILNGQVLAQQVNELTITELPGGKHQVKLIPSNISNYQFNGFQGQNNILFQGNIQVAQNQRINAMVYQGQLIILEQTALQSQPVFNAMQGQIPPSNVNSTYDNYLYQAYQGAYSYPNNHPHIPGTNNHWNVPAPVCPSSHQAGFQIGHQVMSPGSFEQLKHSMNAQWFSSGQRDVFRQALQSNYFTSQQVFELVSIFTFSSDQLEVAKQAYVKTVDPQNYFIVNNALEFSSAVSALSSYIASL